MFLYLNKNILKTKLLDILHNILNIDLVLKVLSRNGINVSVVEDIPITAIIS